MEDALLESSQQALFGESLLVLPEAFNVIEDYYYPTYVLDLEVEKRLIGLSGRLGLCFVVGLIRNDDTRHSEAVLIDGADRKVLSRKTLCDRSPCYTPFTQRPQDDVILHRNLSSGALICMDATDGDDMHVRENQRTRHAAIVTEFGQYPEATPTLLCVPARFGTSSPVEVAKTWNQKKVSIIIANCGTLSYPSVLHFENELYRFLVAHIVRADRVLVFQVLPLRNVLQLEVLSQPPHRTGHVS